MFSMIYIEFFVELAPPAQKASRIFVIILEMCFE